MDEKYVDSAEELLEKGLEKLKTMDPTSDAYLKLLDRNTKLLAVINASKKNDVLLAQAASNREAEFYKADALKEVEDKKSEASKKVENLRNAGTFFTAVLNGLVTLLGIFATVKTTQASIEAMDRRFELATKKEFDEPFTTLTNKTTVQDGLRDNSKFKFF